MPPSLCLFLGGASSFNIRQSTQNIIRLLSGTFDINLVTTDLDSFKPGVLTGVKVFGTSAPSTRVGEVTALSNYLRKNNPVVAAHLSEPPVHGTAVTVLGRRHDVPTVYRYSGDRFYEYQLSRGKKRLLHFGLNNVFGRIPLFLADACIALGPTGKTRLTDRGVDPDQIGILPPPVDQTRFDEADELPALLSDVPGLRSVVLFVGRRSYLKGLDTLETAIPQILDRRGDIQFVLVGGGDRIPRVPNPYADHITVVGRVSPESIVDYFHHADVLVHPSLTEGVSRTLVEALMCGTPVIARDIGDLASVTSNLFTTDAEFVDMVCGFEDLPLNDPHPFSMAALKDQYLSFFAQFV